MREEQEEAWSRAASAMERLDEARADGRYAARRAEHAEELATGLRAATQDGIVVALTERDAALASVASLRTELALAESHASPALQRQLNESRRQLQATRVAAARAEAATLRWGRAGSRGADHAKGSKDRRRAGRDPRTPAENSQSALPFPPL